MDNRIIIPISQKDRELLLTYEPYFASHELFRLISIAVKKGRQYELSFTEDQLDDFLEQVAAFCNHEEDEELQCALEDIYDNLEQYSETYAEDDFSEYSNNTGSVCLLKVTLLGDDDICRTIAIRQGQTLHELHDSIFEAFDRYDDHLYSFFFPHSPRKKLNLRNIHQSADEYTHPYACEDQGPFSSKGQNAAVTAIESLHFETGQVFFYIFDFGDEWWHEITVESTDGQADDGAYPRIIERQGMSPDQYPGFEEE